MKYLDKSQLTVEGAKNFNSSNEMNQLHGFFCIISIFRMQNVAKKKNSLKLIDFKVFWHGLFIMFTVHKITKEILKKCLFLPHCHLIHPHRE